MATSNPSSATAEMLKKKTKPVKKAEVEQVHIHSGNVLEELTSTIQSLDKEGARKSLDALLESEGLNDFRLGGILALYQGNPDWWGEDQTFKSFVNANVNLHYRKVMYLIKIYVNLVDKGISWDLVKSIGWTKLKEIVEILTPDNVDEWIKKAGVMTVLQLMDAVRAYKKSLAPGTDEEPGNETGVTTMTFKVHEDQKEQIQMALDKAKIELNTEAQTVALEGICTSYLSGAVTMATPTLKQALKGHTAEQIFDAVEENWPGIIAAMAQNLEVPAEPSLPELFTKYTVKEVLDVVEKVWPQYEITIAS